MKSSKKIGLLSFGMLASVVLPQAVDSNSYVHNLLSNKFNNSNNVIDFKKEAVVTASTYAEAQTPDYVYLSDIKYSSAKVGWGSLALDKYSDGSKLTLNVNGSYVTFDKGIFAHATSTITYDLTEYSDYAYFTTYYGVNKTSNGNGNGVKFYIYTSEDGVAWNTALSSNALLSTAQAGYAKIDIRGAKYLRLYANDNGANGNDHAVWADSKLIKEGYTDEVTMSVAEYDELIKSKYNGKDIDEELELLILQRHIVNRVGSYQLKQIYKDENAKAGFDWAFNDLDTLRLYVMGGNPDGTYLRSFQVLGELYNLYKDDLNDSTLSPKYKIENRIIYKKMMITLSLTHSQTVSFWINSSTGESFDKNPNISVAKDRYAIYKKMYLNGKLHNYFEQLEVEEMRYVMNSFINDDEIEWLRDYIISSGKNWKSSYQFMNYKNVNTALYRNEMFYGENRAQWEERYKLTGYDVANVKYFPKVFMIMNIGGVCWQISNVGQNMVASYGVPSTMVGQPSHVAYLVYDVNGAGNATWSIWNNVGGWQSMTVSAYTGHKSYYAVRLLNGWGNGSYASNNRGSYILLGQAALNDYDNYVKAQEKVLLANTYVATGDKETADRLYREALEIQSINFDALFNLIVLHINEKNGLFGDYNADLYELAELAADKLKYYPLPMYDMLRYISNNMTDVSYKGLINLLENRTLTQATKATESQVLQSDVCRTMANYLLGALKLDIASFAFDGSEGATLSLSSLFNNANPLWDYSLDGGKTWTTVNDGNSVVLSEEEIAKINSTSDILVHLIGVNYDEKNLFKIDIKDSVGLPSMLYANDWENKLMDATDAMEWKYNENDGWTSFKNELPDLKGDKRIFVRVGATGVYLPSEIREFTFTSNGEDDLTKTYVSVDHLEVVDFSSQTYRTGNDERAIYAVDGNANRYWLTSRTTLDHDRYITIKLDKAMYISMLQYLPYSSTASGAGRMLEGNIYISLDGENWTLAKSVTGLANDDTMKDIIFDEPVYTQYVKIQATKSTDTPNNDRNIWMSAAMINFYTDLTKAIPTAELEYSRSSTTALPVTVKLVNPSEDITITNNGGSDTYTFTKNGEFIFEYVDKYGNKGSTKAVVDWIVDYSFAFDGDDPYSIILGSKYDGIDWSFSIDGGSTWNKKSALIYTLKEDEINELSATNDLKIRFDNSDEIVTIDILEGTSLPSNLYANDLENRVLGVTDVMEWRIVGDDNWTLFKDEKPNLKGNKSVEIRVAAHGTTLRSASKVFNFTDAGENDAKYTYVSIDHLEIAGFSSQTVREGNLEYATNAIDGYRDTFWFTSRTTVDTEKYIIIKLDDPRYISKVQYVPGLSSNSKVQTYGLMTDGIVSISKDGENWTTVATVSGLEINDYPKDIVFDEPVYAQYVKIQATHTYQPNANDNQFFQASMINIFEDKTEEFESTVRAIYSTESRTNEDVTVQLVSNNAFITITNNNGSDTYTFTENGEFTFEYTDEFGHEGTYKVEVTWIDKEAPIGTIEYSPIDKTNGNVVAKLVTDEEITITNNGGKDTYTFTENGEFTFEYVDDLGNVGKVTAKVDWIVKEAPEVSFVYDIETITNKDVTVTIECEENITILNNDGKNTYTFTRNGEFEFEYQDEYGNKGRAIAKVDWIDKEAPVGEIIYGTTNKTNQDVIVKLTTDEKVTITNNNGSEYYTFTENGEFTFEFEDEAGNKGTVTAKVDWIDRELDPVEITYDIDSITNKNVTARVILEEGFELLNKDGLTYHVFTKNGTYEFEYKDAHGNIGVAVAVVTWIDKEAPVGTVSYSITDRTHENVIVTLDTNEKVTITNNGGKNTYTFTENGEFTFEFEDEAGNKGTVTAKVDWIISEAEELEITYNIKNKTNKNVVSTVELTDGATITNNDGKNTYTFTKNGEFTFEYTDKYGNKGTITAKVDWIDKIAPKADLQYSIETYTDSSVAVKITNFSEKVTIVNNNGSDTYIFTENGEFTFIIEDEAGNRSSIVAKVDWIKVRTKVSVEFSEDSTTNKDVIATIKSDKPITITNNEGKNTYTFTKNGTFTFEYVDEYGDTYEYVVIVSWIIKEAESVEIVYSTTDKTDKEVVAIVNLLDGMTITNNEGKNTYTFTKNGEFTFEYVDKNGNKGTVTAKVDWIDEVKLNVEIQYSTKQATSSSVIATIKSNKKIKILNNGGSDKYTFDKNGEFTFQYEDEYGNKGTIVAKVDWIHKEIPTAEIEYSIKDITNKDVTVKLVNPSTEIVIVNNDGKDTYTFTKNGEFTFEIMDAYGNIGKVTAKVDWIDKEAPTATIEYSELGKTKGPVIVTIKPSEDVTILNNGGKASYIFVENGTFTFEFVDKAGNKGTITAIVNWIVSEAPELNVTYDISSITNKDVTATLEVKDGIKITNNNGSNKYTFTKNGTFAFEYEDEYGNKGVAVAVVTWIDKEAPTASIDYDIRNKTNKDVVASLVNPSEKIIVINDEDGVYIFTENGEYIFEFKDEAGNIGRAIAKVDWIDKEAPTATIEYSTTLETEDSVVVKLKPSEKVTITNNGGKDTYTFTKNGEFTFEYVDEAGNKGTTTAKVTWIVDKKPVIEISYDKEEPTPDKVVVTISLPEGYKILNNNGSNIFIFTENGEFTFEYEDSEGNKGTKTVKVDWICEENPVLDVSYDITNPTNKDVVATIELKAGVTITNNDGKNTYTFTKNGEFTFEYVDAYGNKGSVTAKVTWINKDKPVLKVTYNTINATNKNVVATLELKYGITITNNNGSNVVVFTENGEFTFEYVDEYGNIGTTTAIVDWIDKEGPTATIDYSITKYTKDPVIVTLRPSEEVTILNNGGKSSYIFTENGEFTFEFVDKAGNKGTATAKVTWIKESTSVIIQYSTSEKTKDPVTVIIKADKPITIKNNNGKDTYTFTKNGEFTFEYEDEYGDIYHITAKVTWIIEDKPVIEIPDDEEDVIDPIPDDKDDIVDPKPDDDINTKPDDVIDTKPGDDSSNKDKPNKPDNDKKPDKPGDKPTDTEDKDDLEDVSIGIGEKDETSKNTIQDLTIRAIIATVVMTIVYAFIKLITRDKEKDSK